MNISGRWAVVSSPDFHDDDLGLDGPSYLELSLDGDMLEGEYHISVQVGLFSGRLDTDETGNGIALIEFSGSDEMDEVFGDGSLEIEGNTLRLELEYYRGDTFTFICKRSEEERE